MQGFLSQLVSAVFQVALFALVPLVWYLIRRKKLDGQSFFEYVGLKPFSLSRNALWVAPSPIVVMAFVSFVIEPLMPLGDANANLAFSGLGVAGLPSVLLSAFVQTSLAEEVLFRGFIGKRLIAKLGFWAGNAIQAAVFGLVHGALIFVNPSIASYAATSSGAAAVFLLVFGTGAAGFLLGYLAEKCADGSIVPSWLAHGLCNAIVGAASLFAA